MAALTDIQKKFILHWGEMGTRWGINRTVAQVHALLFISPKPMDADTIMETLKVARSNVSNSLRELQNWGIIKVVHIMGERRDHFESLKDVWEIFKLVLAERKRREIDPTISVLSDCLAEAGKGASPGAGGTAKGNGANDYEKQRLRDMMEFFEAGTVFFNDVNRLSPDALRKIGKLSGKITKLLGLVS